MLYMYIHRSLKTQASLISFFHINDQAWNLEPHLILMGKFNLKNVLICIHYYVQSKYFSPPSRLAVASRQQLLLSLWLTKDKYSSMHGVLRSTYICMYICMYRQAAQSALGARAIPYSDASPPPAQQTHSQDQSTQISSNGKSLNAPILLLTTSYSSI